MATSAFQNPLLSEQNGSYDNTALLSQSSKAVRQGFIKKVYGILAAQLALTTVIAAPFVLGGESTFQWEINNSWILYLSVFMTMAVVCAGACKPDLFRTYPQNYILLFSFTVFEAVIIGFISSMYTVSSVVLVFGLTMCIFGALTIFANTTSYDLTDGAFSAYLFAALCGLAFTGFIMMLLPQIAFMQKLYAGAGAIIFSLYIVYDTQMIVGGRHKHSFRIDDYAFAALNIYLDIVNLFLDLLRLLGEERR